MVAISIPRADTYFSYCLDVKQRHEVAKRVGQSWARPRSNSYRHQRAERHILDGSSSISPFIATSRLISVCKELSEDLIPSPSSTDTPQPPTSFQLLLQLHSPIRPGLSESEFRSLFASCSCGLIMTKTAFSAHRCPILGGQVVDNSDEDEIDVESEDEELYEILGCDEIVIEGSDDASE